MILLRPHEVRVNGNKYMAINYFFLIASTQLDLLLWLWQLKIKQNSSSQNQLTTPQ